MSDEPTETLVGRVVAIVGAGPAGLAAAEVLSTTGAKVIVLEAMPTPARKFLMAGRGGLNLTHSEPLAAFLERYGPSAAPIRQAVAAFPPQAVVAWAVGLGQPAFVGSSGRVFPKAMKASPLLRAWLARLAQQGVEFRPRRRVVGLAPGPVVKISREDGTAYDLAADAVLLAMGGASWPRLGGDGAWQSWLADAGIAVAPLRPANAGLLVSWPEPVLRHAGTPLKRIAITAAGRRHYGECILTRSGLEGGLIYPLGEAIGDALGLGPLTATLDLRPDRPCAAIAQRLARVDRKQSLVNRLRKGAGLDAAAIAILRSAGEPPRDNEALAALVKAVPVTVIGKAGLARAISSAGGIRLDELNLHFMINRMPGVFAAGEMLDWSAPTGGYLLQACIATGRAAAAGIARHLTSPAPRVP